tara:strand:+ start:545 stop:1411 length:867 start_codon:yes stop_codon:yes gene_type:complete
VSRSLRVLLVEDEPDIRELVRDVLAAQGHEVCEAGSQRQAEALLDAQAAAPFDLALLDLGIPLRPEGQPNSGVGQALMEIVGREGLPFAVFTGQVKRPSVILRAGQLGCLAYLLKDDADLGQALQQIASAAPRRQLATDSEPAPQGAKPRSRRARGTLPLRAKRWADCVLRLDHGQTLAKTKSGASAPAQPVPHVLTALYALYWGKEEGTDFGHLVGAKASRRVVAKRVRAFLRAAFEVSAEGDDPLPYQRALKRWVCEVRLQSAEDLDLDQQQSRRDSRRSEGWVDF